MESDGTVNINFNFPKSPNLPYPKNITVNPKSDSQKMSLTGERKAQILIAIDSTSFQDVEQGLKFHGKLTEPRLSLNGWIYFPQELAPQDDKDVPLTMDHEEAFTDNPTIRGSMHLTFDENTWDLNYTAIATDKEAIAGIKSGKYKHVSMTAEWEGQDEIRGWLVPKGVTTTHGSLVEEPGITSATVVTDAYVKCCNGLFPLQKCDSKILSELKTELRQRRDAKKKQSHSSQSNVDTSQKKKNDTSNSRMPKTDNDETLATVLAEVVEEEKQSMEEIKEQLAVELEIHESVVESILNGDQAPSKEFLDALVKIANVDESKLDAFRSDEEEEEEEDMEEEEEEEKPKGDKTSKDTKPKKDSKPAETKVTIKNDGKPQELTIKVDAKIDATDVTDALNRHLNTIISKKKTKGKVDSKILSKKEQRTKFYDKVTESLKKFQIVNMDWIQKQLRTDGIALDAIGLTEVGTAAGAQWLEDITILPSGLEASLRTTCEVVQIQRGAKEVHFTLISTPVPGDGDAPTVPGDATQTITDVVATPAERVLKQRVTDQAARTTSVNLGNAIAQTFRNAEALDEDQKILAELDGLTEGSLAGSIIPDGAANEGAIDATDPFVAKHLAAAKRAILRKGWKEAKIPGKLVCVMSPEQMEQLMGDTTIQRFIEWVSEGEGIKTGMIPRLHGIDLLVSTEVPTGTGSATNIVTHHAYVYVREVAMGLGFTKEVEIESARYPEERATTLVASYELAAKNKAITAVARITTYGTTS